MSKGKIKEFHPSLSEWKKEVWYKALTVHANYYENGKFIFKDFRTEEEINESRIQQIEHNCNQAIEAVYSIYKQINITNLLTPYIEQDRDVMKTFIDNKRTICHQAITNDTKVKNVDFGNES